MIKRVAYLPAGRTTNLPFEQVGTAIPGTWGLVSDEEWLKGEFDDPLELLYLSVEDYEKALYDSIDKVIEEAAKIKTKDIS